MAEWDRNSPWRQGHFLPSDACRNLQLDDSHVAVVISHDCDLALDVATEPHIELIVARIVEKADGNLTHAKSIRKLHLTTRSGVVIELLAAKRAMIGKSQLASFEPDKNMQLSASDVGILQRWMA